MVTSNGIDSAILKAKFGDDIRKTEIHHTQDLNFNDLVLMMQRFFQIKPTDSVSLKYRDSDNDWITLANDDDVSFALRHEPHLFVEVHVEAVGEENFSTSPPILSHQQQQKPATAVYATDHQDDFDQKSVILQTPKLAYQDNDHQPHVPPSTGGNDATAPPSQPQQPPPLVEMPQSALIDGGASHQSQPLFTAQKPTYGGQQQPNSQPQPFGVPPPQTQQLYGAPTPTFGGGQPPMAPPPSQPSSGEASHAQPPPSQTFYSAPNANPSLAAPPTSGQLSFGAMNGTPTGYPHSAYQPQAQQIAQPPFFSAAGSGGYAPPTTGVCGMPPASYPYQPSGSNTGYPPSSIPTGGPPMFSQQQATVGGNPFARAAQPPGGRPPGAYYQ